MALPPPGRKFCQCYAGCPATLNVGSSWRYSHGHAASGKAKHHLKRTHKPDPDRSVLDDMRQSYTTAVATAKFELDPLSSEIDRLETQAVAAEATARAARKAANECTNCHDSLTVIVKALQAHTEQVA